MLLRLLAKLVPARRRLRTSLYPPVYRRAATWTETLAIVGAWALFFTGIALADGRNTWSLVAFLFGGMSLIQLCTIAAWRTFVRPFSVREFVRYVESTVGINAHLWVPIYLALAILGVWAAYELVSVAR